jgi:hypothetical protein
MANIIGPAPEALNNEQIIARYGEAIQQVIDAASDPQYDFERQIQLNQARLNWQFMKGNHFGVPGNVNTQYGPMVDWVASDAALGNTQTGAQALMCPPVNVIAGDCFKFMAVMGQNSPRVKGVADDTQDVESIDAAGNADVNIRDWWIKQQVDRKWKAVPFHQFTTGPAFLYVDWVTDRTKYGESTEPKIELQEGEDGIPMPVVTGDQSYANGDAELSIHSVLEVSIPFEAKELRGNWLKFEVMRPKWDLLDLYKGTDGKPGKLEAYRFSDPPDQEMSGSSMAAAEARDSVATPSGTGTGKKPKQWRHVQWWIPPTLFEAIENPEARKVFQTQFSDGLYVARVGSLTCKIDNRKVTDNWGVVRIGRGEKIMDRPLCADGIPLQRALNDLVGIMIETLLRAITMTVADSQYLDREALSTKDPLPAEFILTAMPADGGDLSKHFFQIPPAHASDQLTPFAMQVRAFMQEIYGINPALWGGGPPTQTFREAKQRKDQALQQLAPQADEMRFGSEDIATMAVRLRSKYGSGTVKAQRRGAYGVQTDVGDMAALKEGGWHAESDDNFPLTNADRRDALWSVLKEFPPEVQQILGVLDPINVEETVELIQIPGLESAVQDQKEKTLTDIMLLLGEQPIYGENGQNKPSIQPDMYDNFVIAAPIVQKWLVSKVGQKFKGTPSFDNVVAYWQALSAMATPPPPPMPPPAKASLSISGKMEDFPNLQNTLLEAAGIQPPTPSSGSIQPNVGAATSPTLGLGSPVPTGSPTPESPIPPLPTGPQGPQPMPVQ